MHDLIALVFGYVRGVWRYRWLALGLAWIVAVSGWVYVSTIPDVYRSSARLFVDTSSMLRPLLSGLAIQPDIGRRAALVSRMLLDRANLERIIRMSDLDLTIRTEREKEALIDELRRGISIGSDRRDPSFYMVSFSHQNGETAKKVVESVVTIFIEEALTSDSMATTAAQTFIDREIEDYETRLRQTEMALADFRREYAGLLPGEQTGYYQSLERVQADLQNAELVLEEAIHRRDALLDQLDAQDDALATSGASPLVMEDPRVRMLRDKRDELLLRYTDRHPEVVQLERVIAEAERRSTQGGRGLQTAMAGITVQANTIYGSLRAAVTEADAQIASLTARVADHQARVRFLEESIDSIPAIDAQHRELTRQYSTISNYHGSLLKSRETARMSEQVERSTEGATFRVIEAPSMPNKPAAPNRLILAVTVLAAALGAGIGAALAVDLLRPVFDDRRLLYRATGIPVLGSVALVQSYSERRHERLMLVPFAALSVALVVVFVFATTGFSVVQDLI